MCLLRPRIEDEIEFVDRRPVRKVYITSTPSPPRRSPTVTRTRISDTVIIAEPPATQYVQAPAKKPPAPKIIKAATPPPPPPPAPPARIELVEVEEGLSPRVSRSSVNGSRVSRSRSKRERRSSRGGEEREVYIERERERIRAVEPPDSYRYVEGLPVKETRFLDEGPRADRRERSRSITYETNPRHSGRLVERERVVVEDGGRRREFYQRR